MKKFTESIKQNKIYINGYKLTPAKIEFSISDDEIVEGDYFVEIKKDGTPENFIHLLIDDDDDTDRSDSFSIHLGVEVVPFTQDEYDNNSEMCTYKKIEL